LKATASFIFRTLPENPSPPKQGQETERMKQQPRQHDEFHIIFPIFLSIEVKD